MGPTSTLVSKIKVQLKLAISRLRMVQQKDTAIAKQSRRTMAGLLESGKIESAKIRVENIIQSDIHTELLEVLELYCELLLARSALLESTICDPGLEEAAKSIIYAAPRTEVKELHTVRGLLVEKYGKDFALDAASNTSGRVGDRVVKKLKVEPPGEELVQGYLEEIAKTYGVDWPKRVEPTPDSMDTDDNDGGGTGEKEEISQEKQPVEKPLTTDELSRATPPRDFGPKSPVQVAPPKGSSENVSPGLKLPKPPELKPGGGGEVGGTKKPGAGAKGEEKKVVNGNTNVVGGKIPEVDELAKRFAALKK